MNSFFLLDFKERNSSEFLIIIFKNKFNSSLRLFSQRKEDLLSIKSTISEQDLI